VHRDEWFANTHEGVQDFMLGNKNICVLALMLAVGASTAALAQATGTTPTVTKVGIVGIQEAIANTNEGKKELDALQQKFAPKQAELKTMNDDIENLKKQLQAQSDKLSEEERGNRVKKIEAKQKVLQRDFDDAQTEFQQAEQEVVNRLGKKMLEVLEKYAKNNGYSMVLDVSNPQTPVLWASSSSNITKELVDAYNAEVPVAGTAPKTPAGSGAAARPAGATTPKKP
jgi:outer membrane protein